jgi:hypothetical protein
MGASMKYELKNHAIGNTTELNVMYGTIRPGVLDISQLTRDLGVFTCDPGFITNSYGTTPH